MMLPDLLAQHGQWRANQLAVVTESEALTWRTFISRINLVANGLLTAGCGGGERVALVMDNEVSTVEVLFGAIRAGSVVVPLNTSVSDDALEAMLSDAGVRAIFVSHAHQSRISTSGASGATLKVVSGRTAAAGWDDYVEWRDAQTADEPGATIDPDSLCNIIYSSGTTGRPKGIAHTHRSRLYWAHDLGHALRYHSAARTLITTGLYSNITWVGMLPTLMLGGTIVVRPRFGPFDVLRTLADERITHFCMVPVQFQRLLESRDFSEAALATVQSAMSCGAPLPAAIKHRLLQLLPDSFFELYGSTEGIITTISPEEMRDHPASVGKPLPGELLAILDPADQPVPWGEAGEVVASSRFAMNGYWNNPEATNQAFWTDAAGRRWLRSGDIGRVDADGFLCITDRKKDMIISGGQNIYPADIEAVLLAHPQVAECAVFGVPSERWGETPLGLVVLNASASITADELRDWTNQRVGRQQRLHAIELRESLPRNANGKLLKRELREPYWSMLGSRCA
ncbi:4-coumarate--CoA ligase [Steroidobacter agaridevorans]|uniref:4-coumarate--CoA ligase n=1 Tax=Steroidobacter agaridevorans TaxID=2695856 RepID=A0A829YGG4_9GAMM|nr:AMP-binding protein [Steroidobacter agaridevorans]GFE82417.1 4-coumarate--CoA ligase [Steroidobacter agaridevorans]